MDGHEVEFISVDWFTQACARPGLFVYSRPVVIERRCNVRRSDDRVETLLHTLEVPNAA